MLTEKLPDSDKEAEVVSYLQDEQKDEKTSAHLPVQGNPTTLLLLSNKISTHVPEGGLNPLVDAAAYLFSLMGKIKLMKGQQDLDKLHQECVEEVEKFQELVQSYSYHVDYLAEYIPITSYALCVTLDDIIFNTPFGQEKWKDYALVSTFIPDAPSHMSFFIILERMIRDPAIYIDVMEFMYICLNLGFRCGYNSETTEFNNEQIRQIINALYKRIRNHRKDYSKILSPFSIRPQSTHPTMTLRNMPIWLIILLASSISIVLFTGGTYWLSRFF